MGFRELGSEEIVHATGVILYGFRLICPSRPVHSTCIELSKSEMRRRGAEMLYEVETAFREDG